MPNSPPNGKADPAGQPPHPPAAPPKEGPGGAATSEPPAGLRAADWADIQRATLVRQAVSDLTASPVLLQAVAALKESKSAAEKAKGEAAIAIAVVQVRNAWWSSVFFLIALAISLCFLGTVIYWLKDNEKLLVPVLSALIALIAGTGGGFVFGRASAGRA